MKISIPVDSKQGVGGGWTFQRNLIKGLKQLGHEVVDDFLRADVALICGVTMVEKETIRLLKERGIKVVVRLDNVPRNSRNRNTGTSRLRSYSEMADEVVWQCEWAKNYLIDFIKKEGTIIYNGVDTDIFKPEGDAHNFGDKEHVYLYSRFNRDETKNWEVAWYEYQLIQREDPDAKLIIVGKFSPEIVEYNFDFFRGEKIEYLGIIEDPYQMAKVMRGCGSLMATYFNDAFSNTYLEALSTGLKLFKPNFSGGTPEMVELFATEGREYFTLERMAMDYVKLFEKVINHE